MKHLIAATAIAALPTLATAEEYLVVANPVRGAVFGVILEDGQEITIGVIQACGLECEVITYLEPNQCVAVAVASDGAWGWERGEIGSDASLIPEAIARCNIETNFPCRNAGRICNN